MKLLFLLLIVLLIVLIIVFISVAATKLVRRYRVHYIISNNVFINTIVNSDDYLAKQYCERSKLKQFQVIEFDDLKDDKMKRSYYRRQEKALHDFKQCFKSYCAWNLIEFENPNPQFLMDVERECLENQFCTEKCPHFYRYRSQGLTK